MLGRRDILTCRANNAIEKFLGVGGYALRRYSANSYDFSLLCSTGQKVLGIRASPGCASLQNFEVALLPPLQVRSTLVDTNKGHCSISAWRQSAPL